MRTTLYHWMDHTLYHEYVIGDGDQATYVDEMEARAQLPTPTTIAIIAHKGAYFASWFYLVAHRRVHRYVHALRSLISKVVLARGRKA